MRRSCNPVNSLETDFHAQVWTFHLISLRFQKSTRIREFDLQMCFCCNCQTAFMQAERSNPQNIPNIFQPKDSNILLKLCQIYSNQRTQIFCLSCAKYIPTKELEYFAKAAPIIFQPKNSNIFLKLRQIFAK